MDQLKQRKKRDTSMKREAILNGAINAFRKFGYETVNMDQIAIEAGASKRTLYNHFRSKDDLLQAVVGRYLKQQQKIKAGIVYDKNEEIKSQLLRFIDAELYLVDSPERQTLAKVLTSIFLWNTELAVKTRAQYNRYEDPLERWMKAAVADGSIEIKDCRKTSELFHALVQGALTWPALFMPELTEDFVKERKEIVAELFLGQNGITGKTLF